MTQIQPTLSIAAQVRSGLVDADRPSAIDDPAAMFRSLDGFVERSHVRTLASAELRLIADAEHELTGFGVLQPLLQDSSIEEIWMNDHRRIYFAANGTTDSLESGLTESAMENLVARLLRNSSKRVDRLHPFADATLADGSRVHVAIAPIAAPGWSLNIRKFSRVVRGLSDLHERGLCDSTQLQQLRQIVLQGNNFLVSGATNAGKTTLLAAMISELPASRRVVSVEESHELRITNQDWVALQGRTEGSGDVAPIDLRRLVRESLRMRPDALVVGEVRGAEALDLLLAMNSGIPAAGTIHAKSASAALAKLMLLPTLAQANIDIDFVKSTVLSVVDFVIHLEHRDGARRVAEILPVGTS